MRMEGLKHRSRQKMEDAKAGRQHKWINIWFLKGKYTSVLQLQPTVDGGTARVVRDDVKRHTALDGGRSHVVERAEIGRLGGIKNPDPFMQSGCLYPIKCNMEMGSSMSSRVM